MPKLTVPTIMIIADILTFTLNQNMFTLLFSTIMISEDIIT